MGSEHPHQNLLLTCKPYWGWADLQTTIALQANNYWFGGANGYGCSFALSTVSRMLSGSSSCHSVGDILLSSGGKSILLVKKKAPSRSRFSLSTHVVLKTRHVSPNIHVHRY